MRTAIYIICFFIITSCVPHKSFFKSPNNVREIRGTIYMNDGTAKNGLITISFENEHARDNEINIISDTGKIAEILEIKKIRSFTTDGKTYVPKIINVHMEDEKHFLFVERLTAENDKMQLYKVPPSENTLLAGEEPFYYYISFPSFDYYEVIDINSARLVPLFEIKMAAYITDCPDLLAKIKAKEKNYYYSLMSFGSKRIDVMQNIVREYNSCK